MIRKHRWPVRLAAAALSLLLLSGQYAPAGAVSQSEIEAQKEKAAALSRQKRELGEKISALSGDIQNNLQKKELLDGKIGVMEDEISNLEDQISTYESMIAQTEGELNDAPDLDVLSLFHGDFSSLVIALPSSGRVGRLPATPRRAFRLVRTSPLLS